MRSQNLAAARPVVGIAAVATGARPTPDCDAFASHAPGGVVHTPRATVGLPRAAQPARSTCKLALHVGTVRCRARPPKARRAGTRAAQQTRRAILLEHSKVTRDTPIVRACQGHVPTRSTSQEAVVAHISGEVSQES